MDMKNTESEYQERLSKFSKYKKGGIDLAFRCHSCKSIVTNSDIRYGIGCPKCPSMRVCPITASLTKFGLYYCLFLAWIREKRYYKKFGQI